jgi:hypothetical protein
MKKATPVRMPWPKSQLPTTEQLDGYISLWHQELKPLVPDPGAGYPDGQTSFWLDTQVLDASAKAAGCLRAGRPDRAAFIRRIAATYHVYTVPRPKSSSPAIAMIRSVLASPDPHQVTRPVGASRLSPASATALPRPGPTPAPPAPNPPKPIFALPRSTSASPAPPRLVTTAVPPVLPKALARERQTLQPGEVNELSGQQGLGISWQSGSVYRIGRNIFGKRCLIQFDANGVQMATYGSW